MTPVARIGNYIFRVFLKHLQTHPGSDDSKVVVVNISSFCRSGRFHQMAGGTSAGSLGLRRIVVLRMDPDGPGIGKLFILAMAGEAEKPEDLQRLGGLVEFKKES